MIHPWYREQTIKVVDIHLGVHARESIHGLVVMNGVPRADKLVCKAYVLQDLPSVARASEGSQIGIDCLLGCQRELETTKIPAHTFCVPGSI